MAYDVKLADRVRELLAGMAGPEPEEKEMFRGITFMVDGKMCVSVSGDELMVRFDPALQDALAESNGFRTMVMQGREYKGYGYISPEAVRTKKELEYWVGLCMEFNPRAKASKKK